MSQRTEELLLKEIQRIRKEMLLMRTSLIPPYLRLKQITEYFNIGKDSVYKYILPRIKARIMGKIKLYKTAEIIDIIDSYTEYIPDIRL